MTANLTAARLVRQFRSGETDPVSVAEQTLDRIANHPDQAIFISLTAERALREARDSAARYGAGTPLGPLDGVPVAWKDLVDMAGTVTTAGSATRRHAAPAMVDAPIVSNLARAGMVSVGKVNLSEFAYSALGANPHFGTPRNARDGLVHRMPGGSSSGSGAAVAAGLVPVSIGTDTGGSVRIPAALSGVVGIKTSEGRVNKESVFPLSQTLDTIGPLANTLADAIHAEQALRGAHPRLPVPPDPRSLTLLVPTNIVFDDAQPDVISAFEAALDRLQALGVRVDREDMPMLGDINLLTRDHGSLNAAESYFQHKALLDGPEIGLIDERVVRRILIGKQMSALDLVTIQQRRAGYRRALGSILAGRLLAYPTVKIVAPTLDAVSSSVERFLEVNAQANANTVLINVMGGCAIALPILTPQGKLPVSLQLAAEHGRDDGLAAAALSLEAALAGLRTSD